MYIHAAKPLENCQGPSDLTALSVLSCGSRVFCWPSNLQLVTQGLEFRTMNSYIDMYAMLSCMFTVSLVWQRLYWPGVVGSEI